MTQDLHFKSAFNTKAVSDMIVPIKFVTRNLSIIFLKLCQWEKKLRDVIENWSNIINPIL